MKKSIKFTYRTGRYITQNVESRFAELMTVILKMQLHEKLKVAFKDTSVEICKDYTLKSSIIHEKKDGSQQNKHPFLKTEIAFKNCIIQEVFHTYMCN